MAFRTSPANQNIAHVNTVERIIAEEMALIPNFLGLCGLDVDMPGYKIFTASKPNDQRPIDASYIRREEGLMYFVLNLDYLHNATPDHVRAVVAHEMWHHLQSSSGWPEAITSMARPGEAGNPNSLPACLKEGSAVFFEAVYLSRNADVAEKSSSIFQRITEVYSMTSNKKALKSIFESLLAQSLMLIGENSIQGLDGSASVIDYVMDKAYLISDSKYSAGSVIVLMLFINNGFDERKTMDILSSPERTYEELSKINGHTFITLINILAELYGLERRMDTAK
jgi:hypothetical protein